MGTSITTDGGSWRLSWLWLIFISLVVCPSCGSMAQEHVCAHDTHIVPQMRAFHEQRKVNKIIRELTEEKEDKARDRKKLQGNEGMVYSNPIRIQPVYLLGSLSAGPADFLKNWLMPEAIRYLQRAVSVKRPVNGNLRLMPECTSWRGTQCESWMLSCLVVDKMNASHLDEHTTCSGQSNRHCETTPAGEGVPDADYILYVTASATPTCGQTTAAHAGACAFDRLTDRPIAGNVNFCPSFFEDDKMNRPIGRLSIAIHEITHALVFSQSLFENFLDENGDYRVARRADNKGFPNSTKKAVDDITPVVNTFTERDRQVKKIVTPKVLQEAREHFGCPTLNGAELENNGGEGTSFSHWESRIFVGELMEAAATVNQQIMSRMTLALFEDSGWYVANYNVSGFLAFGRGKGCAFALKACNDPSAGAVFKDYACEASTGNNDKAHLCTYDGFAVGFCSSCGANDPSCTADGCARVTGFNNFLCIDGNSSFPSTLEMKTGPSARCFRKGSEPWLSKGRVSTSGFGAGCYERRCVEDNSSGSYQLIVSVEPGVVVNCIDNEMVPLPRHAFHSGSLGPCPVAKDYCLQNNCLNDCSGNGHCFNGTCYCFPSYGDYDCSKSTCFPSSCLSPKVCDDSLGICRLESEVPPRPQSILSPLTNGAGTEAEDKTALCEGAMVFSWSGTVNSTTSVFQKEFKQYLVKAAENHSKSASFSGEVKVSADLLEKETEQLSAIQSLTVTFAVNFAPKTSKSTAEDAANLLSKQISNDPRSIFSSNPDLSNSEQVIQEILSKGNVTVTRIQATPQGDGQNGFLPNNIPKKILGIKTVYFALVLGLVLSSLISLLCCCTCYGGKGKREKYYQRQNPGYPGMRPYPSSAPPSRTVYA